MFITLFVKEPFKVGIGEDSILQFVDAEWAMANTSTGKEANAVFLIVFIFLAFETLSFFSVNELVI